MKPLSQEELNQIDTMNMWDLISGFPEQLEDGIGLSESFNISIPDGDINSIVLCGMGGSALAADIVRGYLENDLPYPLITIRGYSLPKFISEKTLAYVSSFSGNTEETLETYELAKKRTSKIITITGGGELEARSLRDGIPVLKVPNGRPPRAALGYMVLFLLVSLSRLKIIPDKTEDIQETIALLQKKCAVYTKFDSPDRNPALGLAHRLRDKIPVIYGSTGYLEAVSFRWKTQFTENSKVIAFHNTFPELCHNEYQGWDTDESLIKPFFLIYLRDLAEEDKLKRQIYIVRTSLASRMGDNEECRAEGRSLLTRIFSLIYLGDFTSYYLSILRKINPTTIPAITDLKNRMKDEL